MSIFSIGAMNQLGDALEKAGWTADDVTKLKQFSNLSAIKDVVNGPAVVIYPEHLIDCDASPFIPEGWTVEEHKKGGLYKFDSGKISLYLSKKQKKGGYSEGNDLRKELVNMPVPNANVLDYLLAHPELIPELWKGKAVFFWGTIYRISLGGLSVRCLYWLGSEWGWSCHWLGGNFSSDRPAALAS
jgi:hypothetical protein